MLNNGKRTGEWEEHTAMWTKLGEIRILRNKVLIAYDKYKEAIGDGGHVSFFDREHYGKLAKALGRHSTTFETLDKAEYEKFVPLFKALTGPHSYVMFKLLFMKYEANRKKLAETLKNQGPDNSC